MKVKKIKSIKKALRKAIKVSVKKFQLQVIFQNNSNLKIIMKSQINILANVWQIRNKKIINRKKIKVKILKDNILNMKKSLWIKMLGKDYYQVGKLMNWKWIKRSYLKQIIGQG